MSAPIAYAGALLGAGLASALPAFNIELGRLRKMPLLWLAALLAVASYYALGATLGLEPYGKLQSQMPMLQLYIGHFHDVVGSWSPADFEIWDNALLADTLFPLLNIFVAPFIFAWLLECSGASSGWNAALDGLVYLGAFDLLENGLHDHAVEHYRHVPYKQIVREGAPLSATVGSICSWLKLFSLLASVLPISGLALWSLIRWCVGVLSDRKRRD